MYINNVSSFENQMYKETNEWKEDNVEQENEDDFRYEFDIFSCE